MMHAMPPYVASEFPRLSGMAGFSRQLLATHIKLYQGYVAKANALSDKLAALLADGKEKSAEYAELRSRFWREFDGMRLHEFYFGQLGASGTMEDRAPVMLKIQSSFGSFDAWKKDFAATGAMRGIGWVALYQDRVSGRLFNAWTREDEGGRPANARPILVLDVSEHAYTADFQLDRGAYVEAFFSALDWEIVGKPFDRVEQGGTHAFHQS